MSKKNNYIIGNSQLIKEWDFEKNQINPQDVSVWSHKKAWWKCEKGHQYEMSVADRSNGNACPYCSNHRVLIGFNDLGTLYPNLVDEWIIDRNSKKPEEFTYGSNYKAWWKCKNGHEYQARIFSRTSKGSGCPYCSGIRPIVGKNDLMTINRDLANEWDYEKNGELKPDQFLPGSHKKVWWKCKICGNSWEAEIKSRNSGNGCPVCGIKKSVISRATPKQGESLAELYPELLDEWDYSKNLDINPYTVKPSSSRIVSWICKRGHTWKSRINNRAIRNHGCPVCYRITKTSFPEQAIFYYLEKSFKAKNREKVGGFEFDIYLSEERIAVEYDGYYWHQSDHSLSMEERKNSYCKENGITLFRVKETIDKNLTLTVFSNVIIYRYDSLYTFLNDAISLLISEISTCIGKSISITPDIVTDRSSILSNYEQAEYESSLTQYPDLVAEWDYEKNAGLKPENVRPGSERKVFWICPNGHSYNTRIAHRVSGSGCPICCNKVILEGYNDLHSLNPKLSLEWNYDKNMGLLPTQVSISSPQKVWWKCQKCGFEWEATINSRNQGNGCPECGKKKIQERKRKKPSLFVSEFETKGNPTIELLGQYFDSKTKIDCQCKKCGHQWQALPYNLICGSGCPRCANNRTLTKSEFIEGLHKTNSTIEMIGEYEKLTSKTKFKCLVCGHTWITTPTKVLSGSKCPSCRFVLMSKEKKKAVLQYDKKGVFQQRFDSAADAAKFLGVKSYKTINSACQGTKKSAYGFIWVYEEDDYLLDDIVAKNERIQYSKDSSNSPRRILQIENGRVINTYQSANEAGRAMGCVNGSNIIACCNGKLKMAYGYCWRYDE